MRSLASERSGTARVRFEPQHPVGPRRPAQKEEEMTTAEIPRQLRKAASIIEERGHAQGSFGSPDGPVCLASALAEADGSAGERNDFGDRRSYVNQPLTHAGKVLARDIYEPVSTVWPLCSYNNRHTTEEIIEQLEKTAAKLEAKEQREEVVLAS